MKLFTKLKIQWIKIKYRRLYHANQADMDSTDCGFALKDEMTGGRLSRRRDEMDYLANQGMKLQATL